MSKEPGLEGESGKHGPICSLVTKKNVSIPFPKRTGGGGRNSLCKEEKNKGTGAEDQKPEKRCPIMGLSHELL